MDAKQTMIRLENLKNKVDRAKVERAKKQGRLEELNAQLNEKYGVEKLEEAKELLRTKRSEIEASEAELETEFEKLKVLESVEL